MKLIETIIQPAAEVKLPKTVNISPIAFARFWTSNDEKRRISNPELIMRIRDEWQCAIGGTASIQDAEILIDTQYIKQVDSKNKLVNKLSALDLLNTDVEELVVERAIVKLYAHNMHNDYFPTLAIVLTEHGEKFCFGESVAVCNNFTVLNSNYFIDTTKRIGNYKYTVDEALEFFTRNILPRTAETFETDLAEIEALIARKINRKEFMAFMGEQHARIEIVNQSRNNRTLHQLPDSLKELPINSRQLAKVAIEAFQPSHPEYKWQGDETSLWSLINYGTENLKVERGSDLATLLETNLRWVDLIKRYPFVTD